MDKSMSVGWTVSPLLCRLLIFIVSLLSVDLHWVYLQPLAESARLTSHNGVCDDRIRDDSYGLDSNRAPGVNVTFSYLWNRLSGPWCISMITNTVARNLAPVAMFYNSNLTEIGRILVTTSEVNITIRESFAGFTYPAQPRFEHVRLQVCREEDTLYFYYECKFRESKPFVNAGFSDSDVVGLLGELTDNPIDGYLVHTRCS